MSSKIFNGKFMCNLYTLHQAGKPIKACSRAKKLPTMARKQNQTLATILTRKSVNYTPQLHHDGWDGNGDRDVGRKLPNIYSPK